jgi:hypothetical protein
VHTVALLISSAASGSSPNFVNESAEARFDEPLGYRLADHVHTDHTDVRYHCTTVVFHEV